MAAKQSAQGSWVPRPCSPSSRARTPHGAAAAGTRHRLSAGLGDTPFVPQPRVQQSTCLSRLCVETDRQPNGQRRACWPHRSCGDTSTRCRALGTRTGSKIPAPSQAEGGAGEQAAWSWDPFRVRGQCPQGGLLWNAPLPSFRSSWVPLLFPFSPGTCHDWAQLAVPHRVTLSDSPGVHPPIGGPGEASGGWHSHLAGEDLVGICPHQGVQLQVPALPASSKDAEDRKEAVPRGRTGR